MEKPTNIVDRKHRLNVAIKLHEIEGNPLSKNDIAMFEMFERENWTFEKRHHYIKSRYINDDTTLAAE